VDPPVGGPDHRRWVALIAVLNVTVPQLEVVGQMRAVSMSPKEARR